LNVTFEWPATGRVPVQFVATKKTPPVYAPLEGVQLVSGVTSRGCFQFGVSIDSRHVLRRRVDIPTATNVVATDVIAHPACTLRLTPTGKMDRWCPEQEEYDSLSRDDKFEYRKSNLDEGWFDSDNEDFPCTEETAPFVTMTLESLQVDDWDFLCLLPTASRLSFLMHVLLPRQSSTLQDFAHGLCELGFAGILLSCEWSEVARHRPDILRPLRAKLDEIRTACKDLRVACHDGTVQAWKLRRTHVMSFLAPAHRGVDLVATQVLSEARKEDAEAARVTERNAREARFNTALSSAGIQAYPEDEFARFSYIDCNRTSLEDAVAVAKDTDFLYKQTHYAEMFSQSETQHRRKKRRRNNGDGPTNNDRKSYRRLQVKLEALKTYSGPLAQQAKELREKLVRAPHVTIPSRFHC